jgi:anti-sigma-K factor RskA
MMPKDMNHRLIDVEADLAQLVDSYRVVLGELVAYYERENTELRMRITREPLEQENAELRSALARQLSLMKQRFPASPPQDPAPAPKEP